MKKAIIHEFDPVLYPVKLWVSTSMNNKAFGEQFRCDKTKQDIFIDFELNCAITWPVNQKTTDLFGILIVFGGLKQCNIKNIAHESTHAARKLWDRIGEDAPGMEADAYLVGWIAECIEKVKLNKV